MNIYVIKANEKALVCLAHFYDPKSMSARHYKKKAKLKMAELLSLSVPVHAKTS